MQWAIQKTWISSLEIFLINAQLQPLNITSNEQITEGVERASTSAITYNLTLASRYFWTTWNTIGMIPILSESREIVASAFSIRLSREEIYRCSILDLVEETTWSFVEASMVVWHKSTIFFKFLETRFGSYAFNSQHSTSLFRGTNKALRSNLYSQGIDVRNLMILRLGRDVRDCREVAGTGVMVCHEFDLVDAITLTAWWYIPPISWRCSATVPMYPISGKVVPRDPSNSVHSRYVNRYCRLRWFWNTLALVRYR